MISFSSIFWGNEKLEYVMTVGHISPRRENREKEAEDLMVTHNYLKASIKHTQCILKSHLIGGNKTKGLG